MSELPLVDGVLKYTSENNISLCMPGHKGGAGFLKTAIGKKLYNEFIKCDITEVDGVDNLHHPQGIIKEAEKLLSEFYGSYKSYFLINGSSCGNLAMIFSVFNENDKVIVERNCHKSIFNGIILKKLRPVYINGKIDKRYNACLSINMDHLINVIRNNTDAKGIIITYPNYYGICDDLSLIISEAKRYNMKVLVDSAHGAHFGVNKKLPESAVRLGADMVVMSAHKTLPSLNQSAYLHVNKNIDIDKVNFYVRCFLSTSPSYMIMCSMDYARYYLQTYGSNDYEKLINLCMHYSEKINKLPLFHVLGREEFYDIDMTRYVINVKEGCSGYKLLDYLRANGIQAEMCNGRNVVLIFSPFNSEEHFELLYNVLKNCDEGDISDENKCKNKLLEYDHIPEAILEPYEAVDMNKESVSIDESFGHICAESIVPYPPGIPIVVMGEKIDECSIETIKKYIKAGNEILGINDDKVMVIKN